jgi:hypothetical protein
MWGEPEIDNISFSCSKYQSMVTAMNPGLGREEGEEVTGDESIS